MGFDLGYIIAGFVLLFIIAKVYKKSTGDNLSELWKNKKETLNDKIDDGGYRRVYITKGIKQ